MRRALLVLTLLVATSSLAEERLLAPPAVVEGFLDGCPEVSRIPLRENEVVRVSVTQNGLDAVITVVAPNGATLGRFDFDDQTTERVLIVAPQDGEYRLVVDAKSGRGKYTMNVTPAAQATDADLSELSAQSLLNAVAYEIASVDAWDRNIENGDEALALCRAAGAIACEADALQSLAYVHWYAGRDVPHARELLRQTLVLRRTTGNERAAALALNDIGVVSRSIGDLVAARGAFEESVALFERVTGQPYTLVHHNVAPVYLLLGDGQKALDSERRALAAWKAVHARHATALSLTVLGQLTLQLGDAEEALRLEREALPIWRQIAHPSGEAEAIARIGMALEALGRRPDALAHYRRALAITRALPDPQGTARNLVRLGGVLNALRRHDEARRTFEDALHAFNTSKLDPSDALLGLGDAFYGKGAYPRALDFYARALATHDWNSNAAGQVVARVAIARAEARRGRLTAAKSQLDAALEQIEASRIRLTDLDGRARFLAARQSAYELSVDVLMSLGRPREALAVSERARSRALLDALEPTPVVADLPAAQKLLDRDTLLLEYALGDARSFVWIVGRDSFAAHPLPPRREIENAARRLAALLPRTQRAEAEAAARLAARELAAMILPRGAKLGGRRLVVVADGALLYIPFAVLPAEHGPLLFDHEIVMVPSLSVLAAIRKKARSADRLLAVFADPVLSAGDSRLGGRKMRVEVPRDLLRSSRGAGERFFERLAYSRREANAITGFVRRRPGSAAAPPFVALDFDASRDTIARAQLERFRIIHFATHGLTNVEHPELSGLVLSLVDRSGRAQDGFLRLADINAWRLNADLVVLSACRTALGKDIVREGLISMPRAFLHAGARSVVGTVWDVRDSSTAELMERFYAGVLQRSLPPAAALRDAQLSMARQARWSAPFYWASFTIQGDWR